MPALSDVIRSVGVVDGGETVEEFIARVLHRAHHAAQASGAPDEARMILGRTWPLERKDPQPWGAAARAPLSEPAIDVAGREPGLQRMADIGRGHLCGLAAGSATRHGAGRRLVQHQKRGQLHATHDRFRPRRRLRRLLESGVKTSCT
jgi:hypothetical protein